MNESKPAPTRRATARDAELRSELAELWFQFQASDDPAERRAIAERDAELRAEQNRLRDEQPPRPPEGRAGTRVPLFLCDHLNDAQLRTDRAYERFGEDSAEYRRARDSRNALFLRMADHGLTSSEIAEAAGMYGNGRPKGRTVHSILREARLLEVDRLLGNALGETRREALRDALALGAPWSPKGGR